MTKNRFPRFRIRYADVASTLALMLAMGGTAYAATALPRHSVGTPQLKANAVTSAKVAPGAVTRPDIAARAVGTSQITNGAVTGSKLAGGHTTFSLPTSGGVPSGACVSFVVTTPGAQPGQTVIVNWIVEAPATLFVNSVQVDSANQVGIEVCNTSSLTATLVGQKLAILTIG